MSRSMPPLVPSKQSQLSLHQQHTAQNFQQMFQQQQLLDQLQQQQLKAQQQRRQYEQKQQQQQQSRQSTPQHQANKQFSTKQQQTPQHQQQHSQSNNTSSPLNNSAGYKRPRQIFSIEQEEELAEFVRETSVYYNGMSSKDVRILAFVYGICNQVEIPIGWRDTHQASFDWCLGFIKRNKLSPMMINSHKTSMPGTAGMPTNGNIEDILTATTIKKNNTSTLAAL